MDCPPNLKRLRQDEIRDEDLYFEDGSVVLSANDSDGNIIYFRVHMSVLRKNSPVFRDMFSMPSPAAIDQYDGVPLVHVHDDAKEMKEFLQVLYDPCALFVEHLHPDTPARLRGPLRLSTKYQVDSIRQRIVSTLEAEWPTTLDGWDKISDEIQDLHRSTDSLFTRAVATVRLARECDIPSILPVAFYDLFTRLTEKPGQYRVRLSALSRDDLETITAGGRKIHMFFMRASSGFQLQLYSWSCVEDENPCDECTTTVYRHWVNVLRDIADRDPLAVLREDVGDLVNNVYEYDEHTFGSDCRNVMASRENDLRKNLFSLLPSSFVP